jgi:hypothetical protein
MPKNAENYHCEKCNFICSKKSNWTKHILTLKHKNRTILNDFEQKNAKKCHTKYTCECGKEYSARNSLWYHRKKCSMNVDEYIENNNTGIGEINKENLIKMLLKNQDVMEKMVEIMPNIGNQVHTNSHNTMNNHFNINMFLNEHCKNAMNLTEFIDTLPITAETYDNTLENGLTKTITNIITNGLSQLDILDRPIHCTDPARKTLYVKDDNVWEKDNELLIMLKGIRDLSLKQRTMIKKWQDVNEGWSIDDNLQSRLTKLIGISMTNVEDDEKETGKIIRAIGKNTYLTSDIKDVYK